MNNQNLPQIRKENIFIKIKNWFLKFFKNENIQFEEANKIDNQKEDILEKSTFFEDIKVENKDKILSLQKKLKAKQLEISDLTNDELNEMIELYKRQIEQKKIKLKEYRIKVTQSN